MHWRLKRLLLPLLLVLPPADIQESIKQLQYYRRSIFKKWSGANLP